jgi:hypothetical protein
MTEFVKLSAGEKPDLAARSGLLLLLDYLKSTP